MKFVKGGTSLFVIPITDFSSSCEDFVSSMVSKGFAMGKFIIIAKFKGYTDFNSSKSRNIDILEMDSFLELGKNSVSFIGQRKVLKKSWNSDFRLIVL